MKTKKKLVFTNNIIPGKTCRLLLGLLKFMIYKAWFGNRGIILRVLTDMGY